MYIELVYTQRRIRYTLRAHAKTQCSERATNRDECSDVFHADESNNSQNRETDTQNFALLIRNCK